MNHSQSKSRFSDVFKSFKVRNSISSSHPLQYPNSKAPRVSRSPSIRPYPTYRSSLLTLDDACSLWKCEISSSYLCICAVVFILSLALVVFRAFSMASRQTNNSMDAAFSALYVSLAPSSETSTSGFSVMLTMSRT